MTTTLTAGGPEDLLAAVPVVLGFHPADSVVMLTFGARHAFHARVDLPPPDELDDQLPELCDALRAPCLVHRVATVAFVVYSADHRLAVRVGARLLRHFAAAGIGVVDLLRAHDRRWWRVPSGRSEPGRGGRPYDAVSHPFAAQAVFDGQVTHASRDDLRATLAGDAEGQARVTAWQRRLGPRAVGATGCVPWVLDVLGRWVETRGDPDDEDAARLLLAVRRPEARDAALFAVSRETARDHLRVWSGLLRRAPREQVPAVAVVTAFAAWQSGHGALAWCALDRCLEVEPDHALARALAECLTHAVPPSAWDEIAAPSTTEPGTR
jgi:Domain of unknown function (DUF4192)